MTTAINCVQPSSEYALGHSDIGRPPHNAVILRSSNAVMQQEQ